MSSFLGIVFLILKKTLVGKSYLKIIECISFNERVQSVPINMGIQ